MDIKTLDTKALCEAFTLTNSKYGEEIPMVRGWIMDELEARNTTSFDAWMMTDDVKLMENPYHFFK